MELDVNTLRSAMTVLAFFTFAGIWAWAWSGRRQQDFNEAAAQPFQSDPASDWPACPLCPVPPQADPAASGVVRRGRP
jgi:cytochrome c oxidase cbb3-type subunit 4